MLKSVSNSRERKKRLARALAGIVSRWPNYKVDVSKYRFFHLQAGVESESPLTDQAAL
jgi:hypothetical protein